MKISPVVLRIYFYKHNYIDRLLLSYIKPFMFSDDEGMRYVSKSIILRVIREAMSEHLTSVKNLPAERVGERATSVFFLDQLLTEFSGVSYVQVQVLSDEVYSRKVKEDAISFDYRILYSRVDLSRFFGDDDLWIIKDVFKRMGVYDHTRPYYDRPPYVDIQTSDLVARLNTHMSTLPPDSQDLSLLHDVMSNFAGKLQADDSRLLIIMEN